MWPSTQKPTISWQNRWRYWGEITTTLVRVAQSSICSNAPWVDCWTIDDSLPELLDIPVSDWLRVCESSSKDLGRGKRERRGKRRRRRRVGKRNATYNVTERNMEAICGHKSNLVSVCFMWSGLFHRSNVKSGKCNRYTDCAESIISHVYIIVYCELRLFDYLIIVRWLYTISARFESGNLYCQRSVCCCSNMCPSRQLPHHPLEYTTFLDTCDIY